VLPTSISALPSALEIKSGVILAGASGQARGRRFAQVLLAACPGV